MTFVVNAWYRLADDTVPSEVLELLAQVAAESLNEPGCLQFRVHHGAEDDRLVVLYEEYRSPEDFAAHCETSHFKEITVQRVVPLLESRQVSKLVPQ